MTQEIKVDRILPEHLGWEVKFSPYIWGVITAIGKFSFLILLLDGGETMESLDGSWLVRSPQIEEKMPSERLTGLTGKEAVRINDQILDEHEERLRRLENNGIK